MIIVLDANNIIQREIPAEGDTSIYTTESVVGEIKDTGAREYLANAMTRVTVKNPSSDTVKRVVETAKQTLLYLSPVDIEVAALTVELADELADEWIGAENIATERIVKCISKDNGVRNLLNRLRVLNDSGYVEKQFRIRCYCCGAIYDKHIDFCKDCGYNTLSRVTVVEEGGEMKVMLKAGYKPHRRVLKGLNGVEILSADQKEYQQLLRERERKQKQLSKEEY